MDNRPGCLSGLLKLFLLKLGFGWAQRNVGYGRGGCMGCGCGTILLIIFIILFFQVIFGTNWFDLVYSLPAWLAM
jgi:hypothetical protein